MRRVNITLKLQITLLMTILVILQSVALIFTIIVSGTFIMLDAEAFRVMNSITMRRTQLYNETIKDIVKSVSAEADFLNENILKYSKDMNTNISKLCNNDALYKKVASATSDSLIFLLNTNKVTGAFLIFDKSNTRKNMEYTHSCIYIRNDAPEVNNGDAANYLLEMGPVSIVKKYKVNTSMNWTLDWKFKADQNYDFYYKTIEAAKTQPNLKTEQYGYWNRPSDILDDRVNVITYTVPLLDDNGRAYAVLGVEQCVAYLSGNFLPLSELPYKNGFYLISPIRDNSLLVDWNISSKVIVREYLSRYGLLNLEPLKKTNLYRVHTEKMGTMFCVSHPLKMYSKSSIFYEETWNLSSFAPEKQLRESSNEIRNTLIVSIAITTIISFLAILFISRISTRKLSGLSGYIKNLRPYQDINFKKTGTREIDDLMNAVEIFNNNIIGASNAVSQILDLTSLPIGGFRINDDIDLVIVTGYIKKLLNIEDIKNLTKKEWGHLYKKLITDPLDDYNNIYEYYYKKESKHIFIRIIESETENGRIGVVLDVTKDIEDKKNLVYKLDHDALTHLYNGVAFKREVQSKIRYIPQFVGAMIFADLDNLKYTNDMFGHEVGDQLIKQAANMFSDLAKTGGGIAARISGDEFAIYIHGFNAKEEILPIIHEYLLKNDSYNFKTPTGVTVKVRASAGIAWYPYDSKDVSELLKMADYAMYEVKHREKGGIREFNDSSYQENSYLLENSESLNKLLDEELITFAYQPIVDLKTGEIYGYELLMRSMMYEFKSPKEILDVAKAQKKLGQLEHLVVFKAFESIRSNQEVLNDVKLFINSIPSYIISNKDMDLLIEKYSDLFSKVVIEVIEAESDSIENLESKIKFTRKNKMMIAIDDFGSGCSNELRILSIKPEIIKLDMEIVQGVNEDEDKQALILNLISFCKNRNIKVIAEGVEAKEDLIAIYKLGIDLVQGYYTGKPNLEILDISNEMKKEIKNLSNFI